MKALRSLFLLVLACGPLNTDPKWVKPCGGDVTVSVSAITLGDDCGSSGAAQRESGDCAAGVAPGSCGFACRQSSLQLDIVSTAHSLSQFEVRAVRLYSKQTGALVDTLTASDAKLWLSNQYSTWDEQVLPGASVKAMYRLSTPSYGFSSGGISAPDSRFGYQDAYSTQVDVAIDGELRTLNGPDAHREPEVAT